MSVRLTESRLPFDYSAQDLGQAVVSSDGNYALVSFFSSPLLLNLENRYVVFSLNGTQADSYHWRFNQPMGTAYESNHDPVVGIKEYAPSCRGPLQVTVEVYAGSTSPVVLEMSQDVQDGDPLLENLLQFPQGALGGDPRVSRELVNCLRPYIRSEIFKGPLDLSEAFLASILYGSAYDRYSYEFIDVVLALAAKLYSDGDQHGGVRDTYHRPFGVTNLTPCQAAMVISRPVPTKGIPLVPMVENPPNRLFEEVDREFITSFESLADDPSAGNLPNIIIDIFNLLRFPKSNIRLCAQYFLKLKNRDSRWPEVPFDELSRSAQALEILASELKTFPGQAVPDKKGNNICRMLGHPVVSSFFRRTVRSEFQITGTLQDDSTNDPIQGARIDLYRTMVRVTSEVAIPCFTEPTDASQKLTLGRDDVRLPQGTVCTVLDYRDNQPEGEDWVQIDAGFGAGWIRVRSGDARFVSHLFDLREMDGAAVADDKGKYSIKYNRGGYWRVRAVAENYYDEWSERFSPSIANVDIRMRAAQNAINERKIVRLLHYFSGFTYAAARYPFELRDSGILPNLVNLAPNAKKTNDCSSFTEALLVGAWQDHFAEFSYSYPYHRKWMVQVVDGSHRMEVYDAVTDNNLGDLLDDDDDPKEWTLVQGFEYDEDDEEPISAEDTDPPSPARWKKGHSFIVLDFDEDTDRILTLESNKGFGLDGPGFRMLGGLDNVCLEKHWWLNQGLKTWSDIKNLYPYRRMVRLRVNDLKWVK